MKLVHFRPDAELDAQAAATWYEEEVPGLGEEFTNELFATVARISALPTQFPAVAAGVHRALTHRFPYAVYFAARPDQIVVIGVFHQHRDASSWRERL
jgi:plasmid stabilization system protein ParE